MSLALAFFHGEGARPAAHTGGATAPTRCGASAIVAA
jgi:hypothetical protein